MSKAREIHPDADWFSAVITALGDSGWLDGGRNVFEAGACREVFEPWNIVISIPVHRDDEYANDAFQGDRCSQYWYISPEDGWEIVEALTQALLRAEDMKREAGNEDT